MKIKLTTSNFSFFKVSTGFLFLFFVILFPIIATYSFKVALVVGTAHVLGTWMAMWRAGKLNWKYVCWMFTLSIMVSFWGLKLVPANSAILGTVTYIIFFFHLVYDEFDLQEEKRTIDNIISSIVPLTSLVMLFFRDFFGTYFNFSIFLGVIVMLLLMELIYIDEINWFFVQTKILTLFVVISIFLKFDVRLVFSILLIIHYFFWFIYPIYKLHKYKREERDGFIMMLLLVISISFYFVIIISSSSVDVADVITKSFFITTIIHVLSTSPFGYLFGLPKSKYS